MLRPRSAASERSAQGTAAPLLALDQVSKAFSAGDGETRVLHSASLELARGETASLVGASGSGKSTLISILAGLMLPDAGRVVFDERDLTGLDDAARARLRAGRIGIVLQRANLIPFLTASENIELAVKLAGGDHAVERAAEVLGQVGLAHRIHHLPRRMSGGEAQRASVALALANDPEVLLADEVTGELDSRNAAEVMSVLLDAWRDRGLTLLFVTHSAELAARAQHRLRLADGRVGPA